MPMAALRLPCRTCVLSASPRLALDIFQARLARSTQLEVLGRSMFCRCAYRSGALGYWMSGCCRSIAACRLKLDIVPCIYRNVFDPTGQEKCSLQTTMLDAHLREIAHF